MKKLLSPLFVIAVFSIILTYCSSDERETTQVSQPKPAAPAAENKQVQNTEPTKEESVAVAVSVSGDVKFTDDKRKPIDQWVNVRPRQRLHQGDVIRTGGNGKCTLQVGEKNSFVIDSNSSVSLDTLMVSDGGVLAQSAFSLDMGKLLARPNNITGGFAVRTPSVVAGVRGTEFLIEYSRGRSVVTVSKGVVRAQRNLDLDIPQAPSPDITNISEIITQHYDISADQRIEVSTADNENLKQTFNRAVQTKKSGGTLDASLIPQLTETSAVNIQPAAAEERRAIEELSQDLPPVTEATPPPAPTPPAVTPPTAETKTPAVAGTKAEPTAKKAEERTAKRDVIRRKERQEPARRVQTDTPAKERTPVNVEGYKASEGALGYNYRYWREDGGQQVISNPPAQYQGPRGVTVPSRRAFPEEATDTSYENRRLLPVEIESAQAADIEELEGSGGR